MASPHFELPYLAAFKAHYSGTLLDPSDTVVPVTIKNPQHGFREIAYPCIGLEYVTSVLNRNRLNRHRRVTKDLEAGTAIVKRELEQIDFMIYVHTFAQDSQAIASNLNQKVMEKTPFSFKLTATLSDGDYDFEIYRESIEPVIIEGLDREIHNVFQLKVWGWVDTDPIGASVKLVTEDPELNMYLGLDLPSP